MWHVLCNNRSVNADPGKEKVPTLLRITVKEQSAERTVLLIEGDLVGEAVGILAKEGDPLVASTPRLVLDLTGVRSVDTASLRQMRQWSGRLTLWRPSNFVFLLLRQYGLEKCVETDSG